MNDPTDKESWASSSVVSIAAARDVLLSAFLICVAKAFVIPRPSCCVVNIDGVGEVSESEEGSCFVCLPHCVRSSDFFLPNSNRGIDIIE